MHISENTQAILVAKQVNKVSKKHICAKMTLVRENGRRFSCGERRKSKNWFLPSSTYKSQTCFALNLVVSFRL